MDRNCRHHPPEVPPTSRNTSFGEVVGVLPEAQAVAEAERCMICGLCGNCRSCIDLFGCPAFYLKEEQICIDAGMCIGCRACADFCPNAAIRPVAVSSGNELLSSVARS